MPRNARFPVLETLDTDQILDDLISTHSDSCSGSGTLVRSKRKSASCFSRFSALTDGVDELHCGMDQEMVDFAPGGDSIIFNGYDLHYETSPKQARSDKHELGYLDDGFCGEASGIYRSSSIHLTPPPIDIGIDDNLDMFKETTSPWIGQCIYVFPPEPFKTPHSSPQRPQKTLPSPKPSQTNKSLALNKLVCPNRTVKSSVKPDFLIAMTKSEKKDLQAAGKSGQVLRINHKYVNDMITLADSHRGSFTKK